MTPDELASLIASRRSNIFIEPSIAVPDEVIQQMATAAQWAPNHKRTWPLRLCAITGESRHSFGHLIADAMQERGDDSAKVDKARTKYLRAPLLFVAAYAQGATENETAENAYAVAAGIQNLLLIAQSHGLASLWGSPPKGTNSAITEFCGMENTDTAIGIIYVGTPRREAPHVERPPVNITFRH